MRIFNGTNYQMDLPYAGNDRLTIPPKSPSGNIMCGSDFLSLLITSYDTSEVAIIVSGPFEISACAKVPAAVNYVVQSLDEAIQRFSIPVEKVEEPVVEESKPVEEVLDAAPEPEVATVDVPEAEEEAPAELPEVEDKPAKKKKSKK